MGLGSDSGCLIPGKEGEQVPSYSKCQNGRVISGILIIYVSLRIHRLDNRVHVITGQKKDFIYMQMQKYCSCL